MFSEVGLGEAGRRGTETAMPGFISPSPRQPRRLSLAMEVRAMIRSAFPVPRRLLGELLFCNSATR
jgi:hypothetical protein